MRDLKGDQFLRIVQAEQDKLLVTAMRIDLDTSGGGRSFSTYFDEIKQYFYRVCKDATQEIALCNTLSFRFIIHIIYPSILILFASVIIKHSIDMRGHFSFSFLLINLCALTNQDEFSLLVEKWNTQRTQALGHSLLRVLYPLMEQELRTKLLQEAKEFVTQVHVCY